MELSPLNALAWICIVLFALAGAIWLADMLHWITIRDGARKILNGALGLTFLGAVASLGVKAVEDSEPKPNPTESPVEEQRPVSPIGPSPSPSTTEQPIVSGSDAVEEAPAVIRSENLPQEIRTFLAENELTRPSFDVDWEIDYPKCAIRARTSTLAKPSARACFADLNEFNRRHLLPYQVAYDNYVPMIAQLSYSQPAGSVLQFLRKEAAEFMQGSADAAVLYRAASDVLDSDYSLLRRQAY